MQKKHWSVHVVECSFSSHVRPKTRCLLYLIEIRAILPIPDVYFLIISIKYDRHSLFGSTVHQNEIFNCMTITCIFSSQWNPFWKTLRANMCSFFWEKMAKNTTMIRKNNFLKYWQLVWAFYSLDSDWNTRYRAVRAFRK